MVLSNNIRPNFYYYPLEIALGDEYKYVGVIFHCSGKLTHAAANLTDRARQSKKISNDQELIQSDPISCLKTKREITKYIN